MKHSHGPARRPCDSCPYPLSAPSGLWADSEYEKLPPYDLDTGEQPVGAFFCHLDNGHLCAGWVGCHDMNESLGLRFAFLAGLLTEEDVDAALDYISPVPLFESGAAAAEHGRAEIEDPGIQTRQAIDKLRRRQQRRRPA